MEDKLLEVIKFLVVIMTLKVDLLKEELLKEVQPLVVVMILKEELLKVRVLDKVQKLTKVELLVEVKLLKKVQKEIWFQNQKEILNIWVLEKFSKKSSKGYSICCSIISCSGYNYCTGTNMVRTFVPKIL